MCNCADDGPALCNGAVARPALCNGAVGRPALCNGKVANADGPSAATTESTDRTVRAFARMEGAVLSTKGAPHRSPGQRPGIRFASHE